MSIIQIELWNNYALIGHPIYFKGKINNNDNIIKNANISPDSRNI